MAEISVNIDSVETYDRLISIKKTAAHVRGQLRASDDKDSKAVFASLRFEPDLSPYNIEIYSLHPAAQKQVMQILADTSGNWPDIEWVDHVYAAKMDKYSLMRPCRRFDLGFHAPQDGAELGKRLSAAGLRALGDLPVSGTDIAVEIADRHMTSLDAVAAIRARIGAKRISSTFDLIETAPSGLKGVVDRSTAMSIAADLRRRANGCRVLSYGSLGLIIVVMAGGGIAFWTAGEKAYESVVTFEQATSNAVDETGTKLKSLKNDLEAMQTRYDSEAKVYKETVLKEYRAAFQQAETSIKSLSLAASNRFQTVLEVHSTKAGNMSERPVAKINADRPFNDLAAVTIDTDSDIQDLYIFQQDTAFESKYEYDGYHQRGALKISAIRLDGKTDAQDIDIDRTDGFVPTASQIFPHVVDNRLAGIWATTFNVDDRYKITESFIEYYGFDEQSRRFSFADGVILDDKSYPQVKFCDLTGDDRNEIIVATATSLRVMRMNPTTKIEVLSTTNLPLLQSNPAPPDEKTFANALICGNFVVRPAPESQLPTRQTGSSNDPRSNEQSRGPVNTAAPDKQEAILVLSTDPFLSRSPSSRRATKMLLISANPGAPKDEPKIQELNVQNQNDSEERRLTIASELARLNIALPQFSGGVRNQAPSLAVGHARDQRLTFYSVAQDANAGPMLKPFLAVAPRVIGIDHVFPPIDFDGNGTMDIVIGSRENGGLVYLNDPAASSFTINEGRQFTALNPAAVAPAITSKKPAPGPSIVQRRTFKLDTTADAEKIAAALSEELKRSVYEPKNVEFTTPQLPRVSDLDLQFLENLRAHLNTDETKKILSEQRTSADITNLSIRLGVLAVVFFLVQILVTTSRYMVRVAGFYDARADALEIAHDMAIEDFERVVASLGPEGLEFGRQPETPLQVVADATKSAADIIKKKISKD